MPLKRVLKTRELYQAILSSMPILVLFAGVAVSIWTSLTFPLHPDEHIFISIAQGMRQGVLPYKDIADNKPPGIYVTLCLFGFILGSNLLTYRVLVILINITIGLLIYLKCRTIKRRGVLAAGVYFLLSPYYQSNFILTEVYMTVCLVGAYSLMDGLDLRLKGQHGGRISRRIFIIGLLTGLAFCYKQPGLVFIVLYGVYIYWLAHEKQSTVVKNSKTGKEKLLAYARRIKLIALYLLGVIIPITGFTLWLISNNILVIAFNQIIVHNITSYPPYSLIETVKKSMPIILPILPLWVLCIRNWLHKEQKASSEYLLLFSIVAYLPFLFFRPYHHYWIPVVPFLLLSIFMPRRGYKGSL